MSTPLTELLSGDTPDEHAEVWVRIAKAFEARPHVPEAAEPLRTVAYLQSDLSEIPKIKFKGLGFFIASRRGRRCLTRLADDLRACDLAEAAALVDQLPGIFNVSLEMLPTFVQVSQDAEAKWKEVRKLSDEMVKLPINERLWSAMQTNREHLTGLIVPDPKRGFFAKLFG